MFLTDVVQENNPVIDMVAYRFTPHHKLFAWKMPLLFPTLEQVETFAENMGEPPSGLKAATPLQIGRWLSMTQAKRNEHNDPYEHADCRPDQQ